MKKFVMVVFSFVFFVLAVSACFLAVETYLTMEGKPLIPASFWETELISRLTIEWEMEGVADWLLDTLFLLQLAGFIFFLICRAIGYSILSPQRYYHSLDEFKKFTRGNLMFYRIAHLLFVISFIIHVVEAYPRGGERIGGEFLTLCFFLGIPWLLFSILTLPATFEIMFTGMLSRSWCGNCNHGSRDQYRKTKEQYLGSTSTIETTTTKYSNGGTDVKTRVVNKKRHYRETYTCRNCGRFYTQKRDR